MNALTDKQRRLLAFIKARIEDGLPPTRQEIAAHFHYSNNASTCALKALERKGYIRLIPAVSRGIVLTDAGQQWICNLEAV